jgi:hypothetical protein
LEFQNSATSFHYQSMPLVYSPHISLFQCSSKTGSIGNMDNLPAWLAVQCQVEEQQDTRANDFGTKHAALSLGLWSASWDPLAAFLESDLLLQVTNDLAMCKCHPVQIKTQYQVIFFCCWAAFHSTPQQELDYNWPLLEKKKPEAQFCFSAERKEDQYLDLLK